MFGDITLSRVSRLLVLGIWYQRSEIPMILVKGFSVKRQYRVIDSRFRSPCSYFVPIGEVKTTKIRVTFGLEEPPRKDMVQLPS